LTVSVSAAPVLRAADDRDHVARMFSRNANPAASQGESLASLHSCVVIAY
jgi:hypothetical protein